MSLNNGVRGLTTRDVYKHSSKDTAMSAIVVLDEVGYARAALRVCQRMEDFSSNYTSAK